MPSKKPKIQLYADECFPVPVATYLKSLGYSILHAYERNYVHKSDRFHLAEAKKLNRILITLDRDFIYYEQVTLNKHPGVIVLSVGSMAPAHIMQACTKILKNIRGDFTKESFVKVTIDKITKTKNGLVVFDKTLN